MRYQNAAELLPAELLEALQGYGLPELDYFWSTSCPPSG